MSLSHRSTYSLSYYISCDDTNWGQGNVNQSNTSQVRCGTIVPNATFSQFCPAFPPLPPPPHWHTDPGKQGRYGDLDWTLLSRTAELASSPINISQCVNGWVEIIEVLGLPLFQHSLAYVDWSSTLTKTTPRHRLRSVIIAKLGARVLGPAVHGQ